MTLGDKLSRLRKENNYTQEQLADILGVSRQAISKWESDVAYPETDKLIRLSALYRCSLDYLVKNDTDAQVAVTQERQSSDMSNKANTLFKGILRYAPTVLYSLWALLLWAFYVASFLDYNDDNLYQWFGKIEIYMMQPEINALISLGVISGAYIAVLGLLQRFGSRKTNLIANLCSFVFQAAVFIAVMCQIGVAKSVDLKWGKVVVVTATLTGVFALLQAVFLALNRYFNHEQKIDLTPRKTIQAFKKFCKLITLHKVAAMVVACVLFVGTVLSIVLPLTVGNVFNTKRVAKIQLGDSRDQVVKVLGKPTEFDLDKFNDYFGSDEMQIFSKQNMYVYCSPKAERLLKEIIGTIDKLEQCRLQQDADPSIIAEFILKRAKELSKLDFKYVEIHFENGKVVEVEYNSKCSMERANDVKWNVRGRREQKINLLPKEIPYGLTPNSVELYAQVYYTDGSYRLSKIQNVSANGNASTGWTIKWSDAWGTYTRFVTQSSDTGDLVASGKLSDSVSYVITKCTDGSWGNRLIVSATEPNVDAGALQFDFGDYRDEISQVTVGDGIVKLPSKAFANFENLESAVMSDGLLQISAYAFQGCAKLKSVYIPTSVTEIGAHAFDGCGLTEVTVPKHISLVDDGAFANCASLVTVNWNIEHYSYSSSYMGTGIFDNDLAITTANLNTDCIPAGLFMNCSSLATVNLTGVEVICKNAFRNCTSLTYVDASSVAYFQEYVFYGCTSLTGVKLGWVSWFSGPYGAITWVDSPEDAARQLTTTYCDGPWIYNF